MMPVQTKAEHKDDSPGRCCRLVKWLSALVVMLALALLLTVVTVSTGTYLAVGFESTYHSESDGYTESKHFFI